MADKQKPAEIIDLEQRRRRVQSEKLCEAQQQMIAAEHALFVALRLAGHVGATPVNDSPRSKRASSTLPLAPVVRLRPRRRRAA